MGKSAYSVPSNGIKIIDIGGMVLGVMDFHCLGINVWFQRIVSVRQDGRGCKPCVSPEVIPADADVLW